MELQHELIMPNDDLPFKMFLFEGSEGNYIREKHWHRSVEVFAVFQGNIKFYMEDTLYELKGGEFVLVNSNEIHSVYAPEENKTVVIQIPLTMFERYYTGENYIRFTHEKTDSDEELMEMICEIYCTYFDKACGYDMKVQGLLYMLLYLLVTKYREEDIEPDVYKNYKKLIKLFSITEYMKTHYKEDLSLEGLAEKFGYSSSYLSRMFQKCAGINYKDYLRDIRTEHGYRDLLNSELTVSEISINHGFPNSKAFSKAICKKYGMMPSEIRRNRQRKDKKMP
jgi:AraC-like DNA-binding protein/quercetin dioxygenase-like cupin family protein